MNDSSLCAFVVVKLGHFTLFCRLYWQINFLNYACLKSTQLPSLCPVIVQGHPREHFAKYLGIPRNYNRQVSNPLPGDLLDFSRFVEDNQVTGTSSKSF